MRRRERPGKKQLYASLGVHLIAVVLAWAAQISRFDPTEYPAIQITLVSPPPAEEAPEPAPVVEEEVIIETPEPPPQEELPDPVVDDEPDESRPEPTPTPPPPDPEPVEEPGDTEPSEELSGEDLNVRMEGLRADFPQYYQNIIRQIRRCFEYRGAGRLEVTLVFYINRDGMVDGNTIDFLNDQTSGNRNFDFAAMGAVECAGKGRFGPLPEEMQLDRLPILFTFEPIRD